MYILESIIAICALILIAGIITKAMKRRISSGKTSGGGNYKDHTHDDVIHTKEEKNTKAQ